MKRINKKLHLCNSCKNNFPACKPKNIKFGDGIGKDNIYNCDIYEPKQGEK